MLLLTGIMCWLTVVHSHPPDKIQPLEHIIKTRSIDLNNARVGLEPRLTKAVMPTKYHLKFKPYIDDGQIKGSVTIDIVWLEDADEIVLHVANDLDMQSVEVFVKDADGTDKKLTTKYINQNPKKPLYLIDLGDTIAKGSVGYMLFHYLTFLNSATSDAFFKMEYTNDQNERDSVVGAFQLRPILARNVFPSFDEPSFKTPFQLSIVRPEDMVALSNAPLNFTEKIEDEKSVWDHFETTPPMSPFTFGVVIGKFQQVNDVIRHKDKFGNDIELRVWGRKEFLPALANVPEKLAIVFKHISEFWEVPLPLRQLNVVAFPSYKGTKPSDNWGLIVFKESDLSGKGYLQLAQEVTHQWLGNYATPAWWSEAYINKAFVGFLAAETAFKINNGSEMEGKWPMTVLYSLYYEYSKRYPHSRITGMKQETACTKIELLFRMFNYTIGGDTFRKGMRQFMEKHKYSNFTDSDIWNSLNAASEADGRLPKDVHIRTVADSWISKSRLPLITATRDYKGNSVIIKQKVYLRERPHDVPDAEKLSWWAPIVVTRGDKLCFTNTTPVAWMRNHKDLTIPQMPSKEHFIIINPEEIAPFPVNYDRDNWNLLVQFLQGDKRTSIPELTRAKLLHDSWNLAYAGELSFATALDMTLFLKNERNHLVWDPVFTMIDHISRHITAAMEAKFQAYIRSLLTPMYEELVRSQDNSTEAEGWRKNFRSLTKSFLCKVGYKPCIKEAQEQYAKWMYAQNPDEGNPISNQFICPVFKYGTKEEWEFGLQRIINFPYSRQKSERTYLLKTLAGCPVEEYKIEKLLNITVLEGNANFTDTDLFLIFSMMTGGSRGYETLFHFVNKNWDQLKAKYDKSTNLWDNLINSATSQFTTKEGLELVTNFHLKHQEEFLSAEHIIEKNIRTIREEAKWSATNLPIIEEWLDKYIAKNQIQVN